jgi:hypothetical protein
LSLQEGEVFATFYYQAIGCTGETFAEAKIVYGVEHVAFAHAVVSQEAVELVGKIERGIAYVFKIGEAERANNHQWLNLTHKGNILVQNVQQFFFIKR